MRKRTLSAECDVHKRFTADGRQDLVKTRLWILPTSSISSLPNRRWLTGIALVSQRSGVTVDTLDGCWRFCGRDKRVKNLWAMPSERGRAQPGRGAPQVVNCPTKWAC